MIIGAEAKIIRIENKILKLRLSKNYRNKTLDFRLIKSRTKREKKVIKRLRPIINIPELFDFSKLSNDELEKIKDELNEENLNSNYFNDKNSIVMGFIEGNTLRDIINDNNYKNLSKKIGSIIAKVHNQNIIHGDLTTSNMIFSNNRIYLIDFGLSFFSHKIEDKAVDLFLLKKAIESKHYMFKDMFSLVLESYESSCDYSNDVLQRIKIVARRGRNK